MKPVEIWDKNEKAFEVEDSTRHGRDLFVRHPYAENFIQTYRNFSRKTDDIDVEEFELIVKDKVWSEEIRWGAALEHSDTYYYAHKDVLDRSFTTDELDFVNAYRKRFILIRIDKTNYVYDNETKKMYEIKNDDYYNFYVSFKDFKAALKNLNLI